MSPCATIMLTIRHMRNDERGTFLNRIVETTYADLPPLQRLRLTVEAIRLDVIDVVQLLMNQGANEILVADLPDHPNVGQIWLGTARDPYTGESGGYLYDLTVDLAFRGQGIGTALMAAAENASRARGDTTLGLAVAVWNSTAKHLYETSGFTAERLTMSKTL